VRCRARDRHTPGQRIRADNPGNYPSRYRRLHACSVPVRSQPFAALGLDYPVAQQESPVSAVQAVCFKQCAGGGREAESNGLLQFLTRFFLPRCCVALLPRCLDDVIATATPPHGEHADQQGFVDLQLMKKKQKDKYVPLSCTRAPTHSCTHTYVRTHGRPHAHTHAPTQHTQHTQHTHHLHLWG
jgi:hypothetical protein